MDLPSPQAHTSRILAKNKQTSSRIKSGILNQYKTHFFSSGGELFQRVIDKADSLSEKDIAQQFIRQICKVWQYQL